MSGNVWFVTGASVGLGRAVVEYVLQQGNKVAATVLDPSALEPLKSKYDGSQLLVLKLDVTQPKEVTSAFADTVSAFGRIDVVYNNAAVGLVGEVEGTPEDIARKIWEVNYWGLTNVAKEALRVFREVNQPQGGRLLNAGSLVGLKGLPVLSHYCASKFAVEGFTESLAQELDPEWNIKVTVVDFGHFQTNAFKDAYQQPIHPAYTNPSLPSTKGREFWQNPNVVRSDPSKAAKGLYEFSKLEDPPVRWAIGKDAVEAIIKKAEEVLAQMRACASLSDDL
jgi:NAD(P)-dependent dehydrogenase (short-subunit alcohol dehydrogenase family)